MRNRPTTRNVWPSEVASTSRAMPRPVNPPTTYAVAPIVAAALSDRGCGKVPTVVVRRPFQPCTSATVVAAPPPKTTSRPSRSAPLASCTAAESDPTSLAWALAASIDQIRAVVVSPAASPPSTSRRAPEASSTGRETPTGRRIREVTVTLAPAFGAGAGARGAGDERCVDVDDLGGAAALQPHSTRPAATSAAAGRGVTW